jgi:TonB-dependent starch-binding outer membrane protein SusC
MYLTKTYPIRRVTCLANRIGESKTVMVMKLTTIFLLGIMLQVSAKSNAQTVTYKAKNELLAKLFAEIERQTGFIFFYRNDDIKNINPVTVELNNADLRHSLELILKDQPLTFEMEEKTVLITGKKNTKKTIPELNHAPPVTGIVRGLDGQPMAGVNIIVKGTKKGTTTNGDGSFSIEASKGEIIIISSIGFNDKSITVSDENIGTVSLTLSESKLDEVQIIAYGKTTKRLTTGNIVSVKAEDIARAPISNPLLAIAGRVPGVFIQQGSGLSTGGVNVTVQGKNSLGFDQEGNDPLYIVDGIPYNPSTIATSLVNNISPGGRYSALNFINPNDIESIEILKDGDATAIYGSRAANGAILINTKKGKAGKTQFDLNMQSGWGKVTKKANLLNTQEYLGLRKEAYLNAGEAVPTVPSWVDADLTFWDQDRYTDWQKELIGGTAEYQNLQSTISGGSQNTQFLVGGSYIRETTVFPGNFSDAKGSINFNLAHQSTNKKLQFNLSGSFLKGLNKLAQTDFTSIAVTLAPNAPKLLNDDGSLNWQPLPGEPNSITFGNPRAELLKNYNNKAANLLGNAQVSYELGKGLIIKSTMGYNRLENDEIATIPWISISPLSKFYGDKREANYASKYVETWIAEPQLTYSRNFFFGNFDMLIGSTFQQTRNYMRSYNGKGFTNDNQLENILAAPEVKVTGALQSNYKYNALFGRISYNYRETYLLNLTARRDGSSRFGSENLFNNFYSIGSAYVFSNENFIKNGSNLLSFGKLRASYGTTGSDRIGDYKFLDLYSYYNVDINYQQIVGLTTYELPNPYLQWEETKKINIGLDLGFWNNRLVLNTNYFRNRSSNQLSGDKLSVVTGFPYIIRNRPAIIQNTGWEFLLNATAVSTKSFIWKLALNLTIPRNKLVKYDGLDSNLTNYKIGESINMNKVYQYAGVNDQTGLYQFRKRNGELTSSPELEDRTRLFNLDPLHYGGLSNTFNYKNISLDFLFQFVHQVSGNSDYPLFAGASAGNLVKGTLDHWSKIGDQAKLQKITRNYGEILTSAFAAVNSSAVYTNASYARLKNVSLSYSLPAKWLKNAHFSQARLYMQGQNLLTISNFPNADPETKSIAVLPPLRVYTFGIQITL